MNILGRIAYYFSYFWQWLVDCWQWLGELLRENILLKEIVKIIGYGIIAIIFIYLLYRLLDAINT